MPRNFNQECDAFDRLSIHQVTLLVKSFFTDFAAKVTKNLSIGANSLKTDVFCSHRKDRCDILIKTGSEGHM